MRIDNTTLSTPAISVNYFEEKEVVRRELSTEVDGLEYLAKYDECLSSLRSRQYANFKLAAPNQLNIDTINLITDNFIRIIQQQDAQFTKNFRALDHIEINYQKVDFEGHTWKFDPT